MNYLAEIVAFTLALLITATVTPVVIRVAHLKSLVDVPDIARKVHKDSIPTLGGVSIFAGLIIAYSSIKDFYDYRDVRFMIPSLIILFFTGIKDDILVISPLKKLTSQVLCALLVSAVGNLRMTSLYGLFGIQTIPYWASITITVLSIVVIINAYNLIDGVNGLAGGLGFISSITFGVWFTLTGNHDLAILAMATAGALLGFLVYNFHIAKIFMGDTGSLIVGLILAILAFEFIEINKTMEASKSYFWINASTSVAVAVLCIPLLDLLRVFLLRILKKRSPFSADRNHIHHRLLSLGFTHRKTSLSLYFFNIALIFLAFYLSDLRSTTLLFIILSICFISFLIVEVTYQRTKK